MKPEQILKADILDIIFEYRNKEYGAYELRKTYQKRVVKSLVFTGILVGLTFTGVVLANKLEPVKKSIFIIPDVFIDNIDPFKKEPDPIPAPPTKPQTVQIQEVQFNQIRFVEKEEEVIHLLPTQDDLVNSKISNENNVGVTGEGFVSTDSIDGSKDIIEEQVIKEPEIITNVEVDAKFDGNWERFLLRNLNPQTPIDNNAPGGNYTVIMQFVVDIDGTVSDIKALSNLGFGLEQEAIRVLKKATKWEAAIQNGRKVKAYRKQAITFQVTEE